jgi:predicted Zn-dependent protease
MKKEFQIEYNSEFLDSVTVVVIFNEDPLYEQVKGFFKVFGFGFMVPGKNLMIIDGEILVGEDNAKDILKFIEAHEVAHILLKHDGPRNERDEIDADMMALNLLIGKGYDKSIKILLDKFQERHGVDFNDVNLTE